MTSSDENPPFFDVRVVCNILDILKDADDDIPGGLTIVLQPNGTDITLWASFAGFDKDAYEMRGKMMPVHLEASYSFLEKTDARTYSITTLSNEPLDARARTRGFSAVGQYIGFNGSSHLVQSTFLLVVSPERDFTPVIGEWVSVEGEMGIYT